MRRSRFAKFQVLASLAFAVFLPSTIHGPQTITGQAAFADCNKDQPGVRR